MLNKEIVQQQDLSCAFTMEGIQYCAFTMEGIQYFMYNIYKFVPKIN